MCVSPLRGKTPCSVTIGKMNIGKKEARVEKRVTLGNPWSCNCSRSKECFRLNVKWCPCLYVKRGKGWQLHIFVWLKRKDTENKYYKEEKLGYVIVDIEIEIESQTPLPTALVKLAQSMLKFLLNKWPTWSIPFSNDSLYHRGYIIVP